MKRLSSIAIALCVASCAFAQEKSIDLGLETRVAYSSEGRVSVDYCALYAKGDIGGGFSYYFYGYPNRFNSTPSYFDALSWGMLAYSPSEHWKFEIGKQMIEYAGNEYDYKPIDVFTPSEYWRNYAGFQNGLTGQYIADNGDKFSIQFGESPFSEHTSDNTFYNFSASARGSRSSFGYSASINFFEYARKGYAAHEVLSGWAYLGPVKLELDVINRSDAGHLLLFKDFSVVSEIICNLGSGVQLFGRYSKDKNVSGESYDLLVYDGENVSLVTGGLLWRPEAAGGKVRFHLYYTTAFGEESPWHSAVEVGKSTLNFGATWDIKLIQR